MPLRGWDAAKGNGLECDIQFSKPDVEGWMRTTVNVMAPSFEGVFTCTVEIRELEVFVEALKRLEASIGQDCEASWGNMEGNIEFQFKLHKLGGLSGAYKFSPNNFSLGPTLSGDFESDQTYIAGWVKQAEEVAANAS